MAHLEAREAAARMQEGCGGSGKLVGEVAWAGEAPGGDGVELLLPRPRSNSGEQSLAILGTGQREKGRG